MIRSLIKKKFPAARLALTVGLGGSLLAANVAFAQAPSQPSTATADASASSSGPEERVIITGSSIPQANEVGAARVDTVDENARDRTGQQDVLSVLQQADPSFSGGGNLGQSNASITSGSTYGGSTVSIHGLPTLVLLNGRRVADSGAQAAGGAAFVDVNLFPTALIKRIEVLKDGASAIYGSEAIGGVVNIILNQEFRGFEIDGRYGFTEKSDIKDKRVSAIVGLGDDKTSIVIGGQYTEQDPIFNRDRDFSQPVTGISSSFAGVVRVGGEYYLLNPAARTASGAVVTSPNQVIAPGSLTTSAALVATIAPNGVPLYSEKGPGFANISPFFDGSTKTGITLDQNRTSLFGMFSREIWTDHVIAYGEFLYSHTYSQSYLNSQPITLTVGDAAGNTVQIPAGAVGGVQNPFDYTVNAESTGSAAGVTQTDVRQRFVDFPRIFRNDTDFYRVVAGFKGNILKSIDLNYDISFNTSQDEVNYRNSNLPIASNLNTAIANGSVDFFSTGNQDAALSAANVFGTNFRDLKSVLNVFDAGITAFPVKLPAGPLGIALGYEYRFEKIRYNDSPEIFLNSVPIPDTNQGRDIDAAYAEVSIPVVAPTMKVPGVYSFDLDGAVRVEKYDGIHSSWVPKASFVYRPIEDLAVRGSFSKSFVAPTLFELYGVPGTGASAPQAILGGAQTNEQGQANPALSPSTADTYSVGLVISPKQVPGLTISGDFFHVEQKNVVSSFPDDIIISDVELNGPKSQYAKFVATGNYPGQIGAVAITAPGQLSADPANAFVLDPLANQGTDRLAGVDFSINYDHDFGKFGSTSVGLNGVYYLQYKQENFKGEPAFDLIGYYTGQAAEVPPYKLAPYVEYRYGGFKASALADYTPSERNIYDSNEIIDTYSKRYSDPTVTKIRDYYTINLLFSDRKSVV